MNSNTILVNHQYHTSSRCIWGIVHKTHTSTRRQPYSRCSEIWCGVLVRARAHTHYVSCTHHITHRSEPCMRADINHWLSSRQNTRLNSSSSLLKSPLTALYAIYRSSPHIHTHMRVAVGPVCTGNTWNDVWGLHVHDMLATPVCPPPHYIHTHTLLYIPQIVHTCMHMYTPSFKNSVNRPPNTNTLQPTST